MSLDTYISERHMGEKYQGMVEENVKSSAVNPIQRSSRGSMALQRTLQQVIYSKWLTTGKMTQSHTRREYCQCALQIGSAWLRDRSFDYT